MRRALMLLLVFAVLAPLSAGEAETRLAKAARALSEGRDSAALPELQWASAKAWRSKTGALATALLVETELKLGQFDQARVLADRFLAYHSKSPYRDRVEWARARLLLRDGEFLAAARGISAILSRPVSAQVRAEATAQCRLLFASGMLSRLELESLLRQGIADSSLTGELLYMLGLSLEKEERWRGAAWYYGWLLNEFPSHERAAAARERIAAVSAKGAGKPVVLVVAPLTGDLAPFGNDLLQGAILALELSKQKDAVSWRAVDGKGQPSETIRAVREAMSQENVVAVVGPVKSDASSALAGWMSGAAPGVPLVVPVANGENVAALGVNVFQLSVPLSELARGIARHAMVCDSAREFAVLAPRTSYGNAMAEAFVDEVESAGGTVTGVERYQEGLPDYKTQFDALRLKGYKLLTDRRAIAAGKRAADKEKNNRARLAYLADSSISFDAVFIAASDPGDAAQLAQMTRFHKIKGKLLGSSGWYGSSILRGDGRKLLEQSVFSSDFLERSDDQVWTNFENAYRKRWGSAPGQDRVAGLGYDAMRFVLRGEQQAAGSDLVASLRRIRRIPGVYGGIEIDPVTGGNSKVHLVRVEDGRFRVLEGCSAPSDSAAAAKP